HGASGCPALPRSALYMCHSPVFAVAYAGMTPSEVHIVRQQLTRPELVAMAQARFGDMVKAVVDISRGVMAVNGELHSDEEALLIEDGSRQADLWGINLYPNDSSPEWIEFDSMINVRPSQNNRSRDVEDESTRAAIRRVIQALVTNR